MSVCYEPMSSILFLFPLLKHQGCMSAFNPRMKYDSMTGVFTMTRWLYLVLFLTWFDCSVNVTSPSFACIMLIYIYMHQRITNDLGACYVFLYQHVRASCSGFSHVFILTCNGLGYIYSIYCFKTSDHLMLMWNISCWCYFLSSEPKLKHNLFKLHAHH